MLKRVSLDTRGQFIQSDEQEKIPENYPQKQQFITIAKKSVKTVNKTSTLETIVGHEIISK